MNQLHPTTNYTIEIKCTDVIQLILQFLKQNKFQKSLKTFQQQSGITLNQLNQRNFAESFKNKNWTEVISQLSELMLSQELFYTTYQFVCDSLIQSDQFQAVSFLIEQVIKPNIKQMNYYREKIMRLQYIVEHPDQKNLYKNPPSQTRQASILNQLFLVSTQAQSQRLMRLLTEALKYQVYQGVVNPSIKLNLFSGKQQVQSIETETIIKHVEKTILYTQESKITDIKLSWTEEYLAIGGVDGLIQLYNTKDYTLYDNPYQRQGQMFFHDHPIQGMQFNHTDQMLASFDSTGLVNIWNLQTGKLLRKLTKQSSINAICWGVDPSHLLTCYTQTIKLYGIRSCTPLKQYKCPRSQFILQLFTNLTHLYSVSTVGTVTIFNLASCEVLSCMQLKQTVPACFRLYPDTAGWVYSGIVLGLKNRLVQMDALGGEGRVYAVEDGEVVNCVGVGRFFYVCVRGGDGRCRVSVVERLGKRVVYYAPVEAGFQFMVMARKRNLMVTYDEKHRLDFWRQN